MKMNREMRTKLGLEPEQAIGRQFEDILTVGSKIFYQTHFYPMIKMQNTAREIYLVFKSDKGQIPVLLNVEVRTTAQGMEIFCGGMEISNRNKYEKELLIAKKAAEEALAENAELIKIKNELVRNQKILESQYRELKSLKEHQQEIFKLISHDLQEPLRKSIFMSDYIVSKSPNLSQDVVERMEKIINYSQDMSEKLLTLLHFKELEDVRLSYQYVELRPLIQDAVNKLQIPHQQQPTVSYPPEQLVIYGDERMLKRLFMELLRNSHTNRNPDNEHLTIDIRAIETLKNAYIEISDKYQYEKFLQITYTDNGLAFDTKLQKIIKKSDQLNTVNIGLAYCKQIVEKHAGIMDATSVKGKGVSYTIVLPLAPND